MVRAKKVSINGLETAKKGGGALPILLAASN